MENVILVTGATRGIGFELVKQLLEQQYTVVLTGRNTESLEHCKEQLAEFGSHVDFVVLDVTDVNSIAKAVATVRAKYSSLYALVNNAGIFLEEFKLDKTPQWTGEAFSTQEFRTTMQVNVEGPILISQHFLPLLPKGSRIVNISSQMGQLSSTFLQGYGNYRISKTALNMFTRILAAEHPDLFVNCVHPGWVRTDMGGKDATLSVKESVDSFIWLLTDEKIPTGKFFFGKNELDW